MDIMMLNAVGGLWGIIISWFNSWIGNFALAVIIFTIALKIVLIPLDIWQRKTMRKNTQKQAVLQPEVEKIKAKYKGNEQLINQKTMELYKKNDYNVVGSCFGLLVNMIVTMVIFFTLFTSLDGVSKYMIKDEFNTLNTTFVSNYDSSVYQTEYNRILNENGTQYQIDFEEEFDNLTDEQKGEQTKENYVKIKVEEKISNEAYEIAINETNSQLAKQEVSNKYDEIKQSFLWIKNIWRPDTAVSVFPKTANEFINLSGYTFAENYKVIENIDSIENKPADLVANENGEYKYYYQSVVTNEYAFTTEQAVKLFTNDYSVITSQLVKDNSGVNGYYILIVLSGLVIIANQLLSNLGVKAKNKKGQDVNAKPKVNWIMMIILPLFMMYFTLRYTAVFALYIVVNSVMSSLIGFVLNLIMNKTESNKYEKEKQNSKVSYSRY